MLGMACWHSGNEIDTEFLLAKSWCVCVCVDVVIFQVTRPGDVIPHKRVFLEHAISHNCLSGDIFVFEVFYCCLCICMSLAIGCQVSVFLFLRWISMFHGVEQLNLREIQSSQIHCLGEPKQWRDTRFSHGEGSRGLQRPIAYGVVLQQVVRCRFFRVCLWVCWLLDWRLLIGWSLDLATGAVVQYK